MKKILIMAISLMAQFSILARQQSDAGFDLLLESIAEDLAKSIALKQKKRVAVWGFVTEEGETTGLCKFLSEDFSVYITNHADGFEVIDRSHLDVILKEHNLSVEGYVDPNTAKELGKILSVDAVITGTVTVLKNKLRVRAKVIDTETALQFAAKLKNLPINEDVNTYLGLSLSGQADVNNGFNRPLNSNERTNNPGTVKKDCKEVGFGDYCFKNNRTEKLWIGLVLREKGKYIYKEMSLDPGETQCLYELPDGIINYYAAKWDVYSKDIRSFRGNFVREQDHGLVVYSGFQKHIIRTGQLRMEVCKSKTFVIM